MISRDAAADAVKAAAAAAPPTQSTKEFCAKNAKVTNHFGADERKKIKSTNKQTNINK